MAKSVRIITECFLLFGLTFMSLYNVIEIFINIIKQMFNFLFACFVSVYPISRKFKKTEEMKIEVKKTEEKKIEEKKIEEMKTEEKKIEEMKTEEKEN